MSVRRRPIAIVAYLIVIVLGIVAIILSFVGPGLWKSLWAFAFGLGTASVGIYAWVRGLGGYIGGDALVTFYISWWDTLVILGIYGVAIGIGFLVRLGFPAWH